MSMLKGEEPEYLRPDRLYAAGVYIARDYICCSITNIIGDIIKKCFGKS